MAVHQVFRESRDDGGTHVRGIEFWYVCETCGWESQDFGGLHESVAGRLTRLEHIVENL